MSLECHICGKTYQRSTHLRRHEVTHRVSSRFSCPYCPKTFARRDVCRKHAATCHHRPGDTKDHVIPLAKRGQKPRACASCFQCKLACDHGHPCRRCKDRHVECIYDRVPAEDMLIASTVSSLGPSLLGCDSSLATDNNVSITFLLDMTHPSADTLMAVFNDEKDPEPEPEFGNAPHSFVFGFLNDQFSFDSMENDELFDMAVSIPELGSSTPALDHNLAEIKSGLRDTSHVISSGQHPSMPAFNEAMADTLLQPNHSRILTAAYFRATVPDFPVTHEASFSLEHSRPELVLAAMMSGSLRCAPHDYVLAARRLMGLSADFIFCRMQALMHEHVSSGVPATSSSSLPRQQQKRQPIYRDTIDIIAAALIINSAMATVNDTDASYLGSGAPLERLQQLTAALRLFGLTKARRSEALSPEMDWQTFIHEESCIRIANWTAMNAWLQAGCLNAQPTLGVSELQADLPCALELWQALDAAEFRHLLVLAHGQERIPSSEDRDDNTAPTPVSASPNSIRHAVELLMGDETGRGSKSGELRLQISRISLIIIIIAIHSIILSARLSSTLTQTAPSLRKAISRWRRLWEAIEQPVQPACGAGIPTQKSWPPSSSHGLLGANTTPSIANTTQAPPPLRGLHRHAVGLAWLAACLLDPRVWSEPRFTKLAYFSNVGRASMAELHELMGACRGLNES